MRIKSILFVSIFLAIAAPQFVFAKDTPPVVCAVNQSWNGSECMCSTGYEWNADQTSCEKQIVNSKSKSTKSVDSSAADSTEPKKVAVTPQGVFNSEAQKEWNAFVTALTNIFNWIGNK